MIPQTKRTVSVSISFRALLLALAAGLLGYAIAYFLNAATLNRCQNERAGLLRQAAHDQAFTDSLQWSGRVAALNFQINELQNDNYTLRETMALDSASRMSELEAIRAINRRYDDQRSGGKR